MAIGGDILIKLGADVAELRKGFDDAKKSLTGFQDQITRVITLAKEVATAIGAGELISRLKAYSDQLQKNVADLSTQAQTLGLTTDQFQAYNAAALDSGQSTDVVTTAITKFNGAIGQAAQGSKQQIDALNELGVKILDSNGNLRSQSDLLTEVAQKLLKLPEGARRAASEIEFFGKSGQSLNPVLAKLAEGSDSLIEKYKQLGLVIDEHTIRQLDRLERQAQITQQRLDVLFAPILANVKTTVFTTIADELLRINSILDAFNVGTLGKILLLINPITGPAIAANAVSDALFGNGASAAQILSGQISDINKQIGETAQHIKDIESGTSQPMPMVTRGQEIDAYTQKLNKLSTEQARLYGLQQANVPPDFVITVPSGGGARNPIAKGGGAGAGATPRDRVAEMLAELALRQVAEEKALATLRAASTDTPLRELQAQVDLQKKIDDTIASVASRQKGGATPDLIKRVTDQVTSTETAAAATKKYTESLQLAFATEKTFGDGQVEHRETMSKLSDALSTGRVTVEAYNEAVKQANLTQAEQGRIARGQVEGIDAVAAGWESAAAKYEKSNNSFAQGGQLFDGVVGLMSDSIIGFATNADFSFNKVLLSFANLLAQMAIKAAASQFFKLAGGLFGGGGGGSAFANVGDLIGSLGLGGAAAIGGAVRHGVGYSVGENGPETFIPRVDGRIMTASDMADQWGGGGNPVYQTINLSTGIVQTVRAELAAMLPSIAQAGASAAESSRRRGGRYKQTFSR